jgi:hypothetical protein
MAKKLHEGAPPYPMEDSGFKGFGPTGARQENMAKHRKKARESKKKHSKRM